MATIKFKGLEEYELQLSRLEKMTPEVAGRAIYQGAKIVADEIRKEIEKLPIVQGYGTAENPLPPGVTKAQKEGLLDGLGITPLGQKDGFYNVKIGFDGYNKTKTEKYPNGQPNQLVARGLESKDVVWKQKNPFVRRATRRAKKPAEQAMAKELDKEIQKIMK